MGIEFQEGIGQEAEVPSAPADDDSSFEAQAEASLWDESVSDDAFQDQQGPAAESAESDMDGMDEIFDMDDVDGIDEMGGVDEVAEEDQGQDDQDGMTIMPDETTASCTLMNLDTGETYHITGEHVIIGRGRYEGAVVLRDPNASRQHAELVWDQGGWVMHDLGSTNGTLVNDQECDTARLIDGDMLTIGVTNLVFRAG